MKPRIKTLTPRGMALMRLVAKHDGPMALTDRDLATARALAKLSPSLMLVRRYRSEQGMRHLGELTAAGRNAVRRSLAHA